MIELTAYYQPFSKPTENENLNEDLAEAIHSFDDIDNDQNIFNDNESNRSSSFGSTFESSSESSSGSSSDKQFEDDTKDKSQEQTSSSEDNMKNAMKEMEEREKDLKDLVFKGYISKEVKLYGILWVLKTLSADEIRKAYSSADEYEDLAYNLALRILILCMSLESANYHTFLTVEEAREFLLKLPSDIIVRLYDEYYSLTVRQNDLLVEVDEIKNSLETTLAA